MPSLYGNIVLPLAPKKPPDEILLHLMNHWIPNGLSFSFSLRKLVGKTPQASCCSSDSWRTFIMIINVAPALKPSLLARHCSPTAGCVVSAFKSRCILSCDPLFLWRGRTHEFHRNSLLNPPNAQTGTAAQVQIDAKRTSIINPDYFRHPALTHQVFERLQRVRAGDR